MFRRNVNSTPSIGTETEYRNTVLHLASARGEVIDSSLTLLYGSSAALRFDKSAASIEDPIIGQEVCATRSNLHDRS
jgi:hypothetical protein